MAFGVAAESSHRDVEDGRGFEQTDEQSDFLSEQERLDQSLKRFGTISNDSLRGELISLAEVISDKYKIGQEQSSAQKFVSNFSKKLSGILEVKLPKSELAKALGNSALGKKIGLDKLDITIGDLASLAMGAAISSKAKATLFSATGIGGVAAAGIVGGVLGGTRAAIRENQSFTKEAYSAESWQNEIDRMTDPASQLRAIEALLEDKEFKNNLKANSSEALDFLYKYEQIACSVEESQLERILAAKSSGENQGLDGVRNYIENQTHEKRKQVLTAFGKGAIRGAIFGVVGYEAFKGFEWLMDHIPMAVAHAQGLTPQGGSEIPRVEVSPTGAPPVLENASNHQFMWHSGSETGHHLVMDSQTGQFAVGPTEGAVIHVDSDGTPGMADTPGATAQEVAHQVSNSMVHDNILPADQQATFDDKLAHWIEANKSAELTGERAGEKIFETGATVHVDAEGLNEALKGLPINQAAIESLHPYQVGDNANPPSPEGTPAPSPEPAPPAPNTASPTAPESGAPHTLQLPDSGHPDAAAGATAGTQGTQTPPTGETQSPPTPHTLKLGESSESPATGSSMPEQSGTTAPVGPPAAPGTALGPTDPGTPPAPSGPAVASPTEGSGVTGTESNSEITPSKGPIELQKQNENTNSDHPLWQKIFAASPLVLGSIVVLGAGYLGIKKGIEKISEKKSEKAEKRNEQERVKQLLAQEYGETDPKVMIQDILILDKMSKKAKITDELKTQIDEKIRNEIYTKLSPILQDVELTDKLKDKFRQREDYNQTAFPDSGWNAFQLYPKDDQPAVRFYNPLTETVIGIKLVELEDSVKIESQDTASPAPEQPPIQINLDDDEDRSDDDIYIPPLSPKESEPEPDPEPEQDPTIQGKPVERFFKEFKESFDTGNQNATIIALESLSSVIKSNVKIKITLNGEETTIIDVRRDLNTLKADPSHPLKSFTIVTGTAEDPEDLSVEEFMAGLGSDAPAEPPAAPPELPPAPVAAPQPARSPLEELFGPFPEDDEVILPYRIEGKTAKDVISELKEIYKTDSKKAFEIITALRDKLSAGAKISMKNPLGQQVELIGITFPSLTQEPQSLDDVAFLIAGESPQGIERFVDTNSDFKFIEPEKDTKGEPLPEAVIEPRTKDDVLDEIEKFNNPEDINKALERTGLALVELDLSKNEGIIRDCEDKDLDPTQPFRIKPNVAGSEHKLALYQVGKSDTIVAPTSSLRLDLPDFISPTVASGETPPMPAAPPTLIKTEAEKSNPDNIPVSEPTADKAPEFVEKKDIIKSTATIPAGVAWAIKTISNKSKVTVEPGAKLSVRNLSKSELAIGDGAIVYVSDQAIGNKIIRIGSGKIEFSGDNRNNTITDEPVPISPEQANLVEFSQVDTEKLTKINISEKLAVDKDKAETRAIDLVEQGNKVVCYDPQTKKLMAYFAGIKLISKVEVDSSCFIVDNSKETSDKVLVVYGKDPESVNSSELMQIAKESYQAKYGNNLEIEYINSVDGEVRLKDIVKAGNKLLGTVNLTCYKDNLDRAWTLQEGSYLFDHFILYQKPEVEPAETAKGEA